MRIIRDVWNNNLLLQGPIDRARSSAMMRSLGRQPYRFPVVFFVLLFCFVAFVQVMSLSPFLDSYCYQARKRDIPSRSVRDSITYLLIQQQLGESDCFGSDMQRDCRNEEGLRTRRCRVRGTEAIHTNERLSGKKMAV